jgi:tetratricopeptide (TPR) repeat protein
MLIIAQNTKNDELKCRCKNLDELEQQYLQLLESNPDNPDMMHSLGVIAYQKEQYDIALEWIGKAIEKNQLAPQFHNTHGIILEALGRFDEAINAYQKVVSLKPDYAEAYHNMAVAFQSQGHYASAVERCKQAVMLKPDYAQAYNTMAFSLEKQHLYDEAIENYKHALFLEPDFVEAYNHLGVVLNEKGRYAEAIANFTNAIKRDPDYAEVYSNMGIALKEQEEFSEAIACYEMALQLDPNFSEAYYNLGNSLRDQGRCVEAIESFRKAISLKPDYAQAHWNLSLALLLSGNYTEGWKGYKWRRNAELKVLTDYHSTGKPRWDGSSFKSRRLLVHYEQGLGDNIQFVRYLPMIKARGGTVIFETLKPLIGLLRGFEGVDELVEYVPNRKLPLEYDVYTSLLDMPFIFETTVDTIPSQVPYIYADPSKAQCWRGKVSGPGLKVGIVWAGSPEHGNDRYRSCSLKRFAPLGKIEGVRLYGLQKGPGARQMDEFAEMISVTNISENFNDFTDTAAAIDNLDLVISVDTSVLHLSGAMGQSTWALLPFAPEWRWMLNRPDSPWYPTMKLFRQSNWNDWDSVFRSVTEELKMMVSNRAMSE